MPQPIGNLGPFTPGQCTVCRVLIPQVEDSDSSVRKWARHLNYMEHLEKYHPEYYKWSKRWTNTLYLPLVPFVILAYISASERSPFLLLVTAVVTAVPYIPLLLYRWRSVHGFREAWDRSGSISKEGTQYAYSNH
jgi:hypothetical protein